MRPTTRPAPAGGDHIPLADRMTAMLAVRLGMAFLVLAACALASRTVGSTAAAIAPATSVYVAIAVLVELVRRLERGRGLATTSFLLVLDGLWIALLLARTGGSRSVLAFLVYLHVVAVTLLLSYRTGLKIALWHGLLLFVVYYAQRAALIAPDSPIPLLRVARATTTEASAFGAAAVWLVAMATAAFSSLNERELRRGKGELRALADMGAQMDERHRDSEIFATLRTQVETTFGFRRVAVVGPAHDALVQEAWERRSPVLVARLDVAANPVLAEHLPDATNVVVVPLVAEGELLGALLVERGGRARRMPRHEVEMLAQFANHAALNLRNAMLLEEVRRLASVDTLTGLPNRRVFEDAMAREIARAERLGEECSLLVLDVDHFKQVNDKHGHQTGDEVLRAVGAALNDACRAQDLPARFGGEEFVVILPRCSRTEAVAVADRLREAIASHPSPVPVTVSAGLAAFPTNAADGVSLLKAADDALYTAKADGRDCTRGSRARNRARRAKLADGGAAAVEALAPPPPPPPPVAVDAVVVPAV